MPIRDEPLFTNNTYHIYNKSIDHKKIFINELYCKYFLEVLWYYRTDQLLKSYSAYRRLDRIAQHIYEKKITQPSHFRIELYAYCLMPTHYHLLIRQKKDAGISQYMANIIDAITRYFNIHSRRKGPIFLHDFKAVRVKTREQFIHTSRYIHLNPYSSGVVTNQKALMYYPWSSLSHYVFGTKNSIIQESKLLSFFGNRRNEYKQFVFNNLQYQKILERGKRTERQI